MRSGLRVIITLIQSVELFDDVQVAQSVLDRPRRRPANALNSGRKILEFVAPGEILGRELPARRVRRSHLWQHAIVRQAFGAITATQTIDLELACASENLEREGVFPFRPA